MRATRFGGEADPAHQLIGQRGGLSGDPPRLHDVRLDEGGAERRDVDAGAREFGGQGLGQGQRASSA